MKKTFTFLAAAVLMTTAALAQNNNHNDDDYGKASNQRYDNHGNNNPRDIVMNNDRDWRDGDRGRRSYYFAEREKDMQIAQINHAYNDRIQSVRNKFFMGRYQKERIIASLQFQRENEIRSVMERFYRSGNQYGHRDNRYDDHDRRDWK